EAAEVKVDLSQLSHFQPTHAREIARTFRRQGKDLADEAVREEGAEWVERCEEEGLTVSDLRKALVEARVGVVGTQGGKKNGGRLRRRPGPPARRPRNLAPGRRDPEPGVTKSRGGRTGHVDRPSTTAPARHRPTRRPRRVSEPPARGGTGRMPGGRAPGC